MQSRLAKRCTDIILDLCDDFDAEKLPVNNDAVNELLDWIDELDASYDLASSYDEISSKIEEVFRIDKSL